MYSMGRVYGSNLRTGALQAGAEVGYETCTGFTAILTAAYKGKTDLLPLLLESRATLEEESSQSGSNAMMQASRSGRIGFIEACVTKHGYMLDHENSRGVTALIEACVFGKTNVIETLVKLGASVNYRSSNGYTALSRCALHGNMKSIHALLKAGAVSEGTMYDASAALIIAVVANQVCILELEKDAV